MDERKITYGEGDPMNPSRDPAASLSQASQNNVIFTKMQEDFSSLGRSPAQEAAPQQASQPQQPQPAPPQMAAEDPYKPVQPYPGYRHVMSGNSGGSGGPGSTGGPGGPGQTYYNGGTSRPSKKKERKSSKVLAFVLVGILSLGAGFGGGILAVNVRDTNTQAASSTIKIEGVNDLNAAEAIASKVMPSVVGISTQSEQTYQSFFGVQKGIVSGVGTGLIVDAAGYIITNSHVVSDGNVTSIIVDLYDGREVNGTVLWSDSSLDLAIIKIEADNLVAAELGDSDEVNIGAYAVAIGNPLGLDFERTVTQGIISGLNRTIQVTDGTKTTSMEGLMQTDASINSGNSGGPLINSEGKVIGINSAKAQSAEGLGFAIPINTAIPIIDEVKETGAFKKSYIGIGGIDLATVAASYQTADFGTETGVYLMQIYTDSPAAKADLKEGDIIVEIDGQTVETMTQLQTKLVEYRPGDQVELTIVRDKHKSKVQLTLGESGQQ